MLQNMLEYAQYKRSINIKTFMSIDIKNDAKFQQTASVNFIMCMPIPGNTHHACVCCPIFAIPAQ